MPEVIGECLMFHECIRHWLMGVTAADMTLELRSQKLDSTPTGQFGHLGRRLSLVQKFFE
jgi:hypothetical protein